jgi:lipopolysaccharide biosynthesis glycosyltransferase
MLRVLLTSWLVAIHAGRSAIDVVVLSDLSYLPGIGALINASRVHTPSAALRFWIGIDGRPSDVLRYLACSGVDTTDVTVRRSIPLLDDTALGSLVVNDAKGEGRLRSWSNFARFTIPQLFPEVSAAWYFDADVLPRANLELPLRAFTASGAALRPAILPGVIGLQFLSHDAVQAAYRARYQRELNMSAPAWNGGVWLANFSMWRERSVAEEAVYWLRAATSHKGVKPLWRFVTQPLMFLLFSADLPATSDLLPFEWMCEMRLLGRPPRSESLGDCARLLRVTLALRWSDNFACVILLTSVAEIAIYYL